MTKPASGSARVIEQRAQLRLVIEPAARHHGEQHQRHADQRRFQHAPGAGRAQVQPDDERYRNGGEHRGGRPGAVLHGVDDHEPEHRDQDDHDQQRADRAPRSRRRDRAHRAPSGRGCGRRGAWTAAGSSCPARSRRTPRPPGSRAFRADSRTAPQASGRPAVRDLRWPRSDARRRSSDASARSRGRCCSRSAGVARVDRPSARAPRPTPHRSGSRAGRCTRRR